MPTVIGTNTKEPDIKSSSTPSEQPTASPPMAERRSRIRPALAVLLIAAAAGLAVRIVPALFSKPPSTVVRASGRIEGRQVTLAPKEIQGRVKHLYADEGATVNQGQVLAELESNQLDARYAALHANLANVDAQIRQASVDVSYTATSTSATVSAAQAAVSGAKAVITKARAVLAQSRLEHQRALDLFNSGVVARSALDLAEMSLQTSEADVDAAEKALAQAEGNLAVAQASKQMVDLKRQQVSALRETRRSVEAQMAELEANLAERKIVAPSDGTILSRPVEVGNVVSPGSPVFVMVDMNRLYVKVYIPEPDIPKIKLGDPADVSVDAFPGRTFPARVTKIYQQAEFTPKNVETQEERLKLVFGVELSFVRPEGVLKPGMPADGAIHWTSTASGRTQTP
jgi:multidrug resistance efflux pump